VGTVIHTKRNSSGVFALFDLIVSKNRKPAGEKKAFWEQKLFHLLAIAFLTPQILN